MIIIDGREIKEEVEVYLDRRDIGECVIDSSFIKTLNLSYNQLTNFNIRAPKAWHLNVSVNRLTSFEIQSQNLLNLNLAFNLLTNFNIRAPNLRCLSLSHNRLTSFEIQAPNLRSLNLSSNILESFDLQHPNLKELFFSDNKLIRFEIQAPNLEFLYLDHNCLEDFEIRAPNLKLLDIGNNPIKFLKLTGNEIPKIVRLDVYDTLIKFVDESIFEVVHNAWPQVQIGYHFPGIIDAVNSVFKLQGHPIAEEIVEHITN